MLQHLYAFYVLDRSKFDLFFFTFQDGVPRTAYKGVVVFRYQNPRRVFLVGPESLKLLGIEDS